MRTQQKLFLTPSIWFIVTILALLWGVQFASAAAPLFQTQDLAVINQPASNAIVQGQVQIIGSADHPAFQFYVIEVSPEPVTGTQWLTVGAIHNTPVINGILETWDTTQVPDGSYTLRLRTVRLDGNYTEAFSQQVVVTNAQPLPTPTPLVPPTAVTLEAVVPGIPTETPTPLPPTPTISIEQPIVETPTPRPVETSAPLQDPEENTSFIPTVTGFSVSPLRDACLYGASVMFGVFLLFGFLAALRTFIVGFVHRVRRKT